MYRAHSVNRGPWWFSSSMEGRFDLAPPLGTCYLGLSMIVAVRERVRDQALSGTVNVKLARGFLVSRLHATTPARLADVDGTPDGAVDGLTRALYSTDDYGCTCGWAAACLRDQFDGVFYPSCYTVGRAERAIALFGTAGADASRRVDAHPISGERAAIIAGLRLAPVPHTSDVAHVSPPPRSTAPSTHPPLT